MSEMRLCHHVAEVMALPSRKQRREALGRLPLHLQRLVRSEVERLWRMRHRRRERRS